MRDHDRSLGEAAPPDNGHRVLQLEPIDEIRREPLRSRPWHETPEAEPAQSSGLLLLFVLLISAVAVIGALYLLW